MRSRATDVDANSTRELVAALAAGAFSAVELLDETIARIERRDGAINAVPVRDFERARVAAAQADDALARGERRPLLGIPMTVKESYHVAGLPTTWGFPWSADWQATHDAVAIERLKAAGAIIAGKTNVPSGLGDWQSYNDVYGTTNNPWDVTRTPGGSSGGSAASVAAGYVSLEIGSDIGGSLRAPAHFCGVFSHKPTYGIAPNRGHAPPGVLVGSRPDLSVIGPVARTAGDLALALDILAGPDTDDAIAYRLALPAPRHDTVAGYRVLVLDEHPDFPTSAAVRGALQRVAREVRKAGASVTHASPALPDLARNARTFSSLLFAALAPRWPAEMVDRMHAAAATLDADDDSLAAARTRGAVLSHAAWIRLDTERAIERARWREFFRAFDVVVCPAMPTPAFAHDHTEDMNARRLDVDGQPHVYADQSVWAALPLACGLPATTVPIERSAEGLPVGVQVIGPYLEDRMTIAFAGILEQIFGGYVAPPR